MRLRALAAFAAVVVLASSCGPGGGSNGTAAVTATPKIPVAVAPPGPLVPCPPAWREAGFWLQALELHADEFYGIPGLEMLLVVAPLMDGDNAPTFIDRTSGMPVAKGEFTGVVKTDPHGVFVYRICVPPNTISVGLTATVPLTETQRISCAVEYEQGVDPNSMKVYDREDTLMPGVATNELVHCEWYAAR